MFRVFTCGVLIASPVLLLLVVALTGCASPGTPQAPSLHLPAPAQGLTATRVGDTVLVSWTTPAKSTDDAPLRSPIPGILCRELPSAKPASAVAVPARCPALQLLSLAPGAAHAVDTLPASLATGPASLLTYHVELLNARGRSAGLSTPALVAAGAAPPSIASLDITPQRNAALVTWASAQPQQATSQTVVELTRTLVSTASGPLPPPSPPPTSRSSRTRKPEPLSAPRAQAREVILRPTPGSSAGDPGGLLDPTVVDGGTYTYTAQRVRTVQLAGHILELRGLPSPPAILVFHNTFPPQAPTGLLSIPGGGFGTSPSIDLSWDPNPELDLLGYNLYRSDIQPGTKSTPFTRLNPDPLPGPAFRDLQALRGHTYTYRVTALDLRHNESPPSPEIHETLPR